MNAPKVLRVASFGAYAAGCGVAVWSATPPGFSWLRVGGAAALFIAAVGLETERQLLLRRDQVEKAAPVPSGYWLALHEVTPGSGVPELSGASYVRQPVTFDGQGVTTTVAKWTDMPAIPRDLVLAVWTARTGGRCIAQTKVNPGGPYPGGSTLTFQAGAISVAPWPIPTEPPEPVPMLHPDPFVGWKSLHVAVTDEGPMLLGHGNQCYRVTATAQCLRGGDHKSPDWSCSCGFYALRDKPPRPDHGFFFAQVELFGRVIEGDHGWRGARQRVLAIECPTACEQAVAPTDEPMRQCGARAVGFVVGASGTLFPVCDRHGNTLGRKPVTPADLTATLGTEVRWAA